LKHEVYLGTVVPIPGEKPKGVKRKSDLINLTVNISDLIRHID